MLHLYVVRHGQTEWNVEKRSQGRLDSSLTEKGINDAVLLGEWLDDTEFSQIISSPSLRTMETAKLIKGGRQIPLSTDERLMEIHLGPWQGMTESEIKEKFPEEFDLYWNQPDAYVTKLGETFADVKNRLALFLDDLEKNIPDGNVLIVTHGVVIKTLYLLCRGASIREIWNPPYIDGTSLTIVEISEDQRKLVAEASLEHRK
ncbi:histidine phosphatase family protein [Bacillus sp. REN3]|uniref:histidine phosphatase family protein n=1 Tax=Bacillus sp. REN3 TaxID=2802440 RepID=UPI001AEE4858|nr:histidine phosphatase family protein [Bacillus sp. REN3]